MYAQGGLWKPAGSISHSFDKGEKIEGDFEKLIMAAALVAVMAGVITGCGSKRMTATWQKQRGYIYGRF